MKSLKITLAIVLFSIVSNSVMSQETKSMPDEKNVEMTEKFKIAKEKLALTSEQELKFKEVSKKYAEKMKLIRKNEGNKKEKHKQIKELSLQKSEEMKAFLSESQFKTFLELKEDRKERMKDKKKKK